MRLAFAPMVVPPPERAQRPGKAQGRSAITAVIGLPRERRAEVVNLLLKTLQPADLIRPMKLRLGRLSQRKVIVPVPRAQCVCLAGLLEPVGPVLTHGFQQAIAPLTVRVLFVGDK
jgi:hypothetical protein